MINPQAVLRDLKLTSIDFTRIPDKLAMEAGAMIARELGLRAAQEALPSLMESYRPQDNAEENYEMARQFALQDYFDEDSKDFRREWFHAETVDLGIMLGYTRLCDRSAISPDALLDDLAKSYWTAIRGQFANYERHLDAMAASSSF